MLMTPTFIARKPLTQMGGSLSVRYSMLLRRPLTIPCSAKCMMEYLAIHKFMQRAGTYSINIPYMEHIGKGFL